MTEDNFQFVCQTLRRQAAIELNGGKRYLVESRLRPVAQAEGVADVDALVARLRRGDSALIRRVIDAMTTNETSFFRDRTPFEALRHDILPDLFARQPREPLPDITVWSAACSAGQEPYSVAMMMREAFPAARLARVRIVASDVSETMLAQAREGVYGKLEVQRGLSDDRRERFLAPAGDGWQVRPNVRHMVEFRCVNLIEPWPKLPTVDVVLLRNVLVYFSDHTKRKVLERLQQVMRPGGYLLLGGAESTLGLADRFTRVVRDGWSYHRLAAA